MIAPGTHVHWLKGDHEVCGTVAECLTGDFGTPGRVAVHTMIVRTDGGGLELLPETALAADGSAMSSGASSGPPVRTTRSPRPDPRLRRELFRRCRAPSAEVSVTGAWARR
ncbi:MAG: hypothetical protein R3B49_11380 [Phycisphaerales bacterium]